jgi:peptidoglycan/xylan/chitin deacetylase (PgdA/CDA1 family)
MIRKLLQWRSPGGERASLSVLIFHRIRAEADPLFPAELTAAGFAQLCGWLGRWFNVLALPDAVERLREGRLPPRAAALTFDDGYADNHDVALPVLRRAGLPCTFFVSTGFLDGGRMWNDTVIEALRRTTAECLVLSDLLPRLPALHCTDAHTRRAAIEQVIAHAKYFESAARLALVDRIAERAGAELPDDLMMTSQQVRDLHAAGMTIGAHTVSHPILARLPAGDARREIEDGKRELEDILGSAVRLFAYPNGKPGVDYHAESVELVKEAGFDAAFSTAWGVATSVSDPMQLPRFTPWDRTPRRFALRMLHNMRPQQAQLAPSAPWTASA